MYNYCTCIVTIFILAIAPSYGQATEQHPLHTLDISFDIGNSTLHGSSTIEFPAHSGGIYHMQGLLVSRIEVNGEEVNTNDRTLPYFADQDHELTITPTASTTTVKVEYTLPLARQSSPVDDMISEKGISLTGLWHPFLHRDMTFQLTAAIPGNFEAVSESEEIITRKTANGKEVSFTFNHPVTGINFIAGPFKISKTSFGENQELYTYFFAEDQDLVPDYRQKTLEYLARYEKLIGPFPYKRFSVVENRIPTGYSMPTFTVLGQRVVRLPFITDTSLGHETLHQWFGNSVRTKPEDGNWAEGLTTLLADAQYKEDKGEGAEFRKNQLIKYHSYVHDDNKLSVKDFKGARSHLLGGQENLRAIGYTRVAILFHMLKKELGEENFYSALSDLYLNFKHRKAGWQDLIETFEKVSDLELKAIADRWLNGTDLPSLAITNSTVEEEGGRPVMRFTIRQVQSGEPYPLTMTVKVITDNDTVRRDIKVTDRDTKVEIPLSSSPRELVFDEEYNLLRQLSLSETPPVWSAFSGAREKIVVVDPNQPQEKFSVLLKILEQSGCRIIPNEEVTNKDISSAATIFLGTSGSVSRRLFAGTSHPKNGITFDVRPNPLNPKLVAVLVSASNQEEVLLGASKLQHYGKYSYLHFEQGRAIEKRINQKENGQRFQVYIPPGGIKISQNLTFDDITDQLRNERVVYIGETHTRYEDHLLQLRVIRAMYEQNPNLAIGMEMFNRPAQEVLDKYILEQSIDEEEFLRESHYFLRWSYDYRLYQPIINYARLKKIPVIALNLRKEIVSKVYKEEGLDGLDEEELAIVPQDLDITMTGYRDRISSVFRMHSAAQKGIDQLNNFLHAQSLWDETMSESIVKYLTANPEHRMAVLAGRGHIVKENGIPPRVNRRLEVDQAVVINSEPNEVSVDTADFVVFSPAASLPRAALMGIVMKEQDGKIFIDKISPHGMAGKSGVKKGDILLAIDNSPTSNIEDVKIIMFFKKRGDKALVKVKRVRKFWPDSELEIEVPL